jgi:class 3 adenylate cyclase/tetratricopeptide (TPR) repeat protein
VLVCASCGRETPEGFPRCANCGAPLEPSAAGREQRKTVTVLFCDVTGSTALGESTDPEALRALLAQYFERMKGIVERHGGTVEKFIGDAVMAVFGVPAAHEDDALRACRAALEMREAFPDLGITGRVGVNTGEVVTGTAERLATGDAVNVAARLEQAAQAGEVLVGAETLRFVRPAVQVGEERRLALKGKAGTVPAWPLLEVTGEPARRFATVMVGRRRELQGLRDAFARAEADRSCQLFTVLGSAGVGKSRLAAEFLGGVEATVVRGRCLSYGEGITYWPVVEVLKQLGTLPEGDAARPLRALLGETAEPSPADEIAWGFRKLLEQEAGVRPLVCVLDDLHWAEETLLDLVEHTADLSRDAPLLLLCMARPELLERRPSWGGGKWNASSVLLEPLDAAETELLLEELGGVAAGLRERIVQVAEGNPLFLEEMLALVRDSADGQVDVPPTIQALLAARLDQLDPAERSVLERGSVEGRTFHRGAVAALADGDGSVDQRLLALVRKELVRPDKPQLRGDDAYRFRHLLIRDAAYDALPKAARAEMHERFALWLEERGRDLTELDEILGHHLEHACRYRDELGLPISPALRAAARSRLTAAGRRAALRADHKAAVSFFSRTDELTLPREIDIELQLELSDSLFHAGEGEEALRRACELTERAAGRGDRAAELCGRMREGWLRVQFEPEGAADRLEATIAEAVPMFETAGNHVALYAAYDGLAQVANVRARMDELVDACDRAAAHSALAGLPYTLFRARAWGRLAGRTRVTELLVWIDEQEAGGAAEPIPGVRAEALAMLTRFEEARSILAEERAAQSERGRSIDLAGTLGWVSVVVELLAGDYEAAVGFGLEGCRLYEELGERSYMSGAAALLGQAYYGLGDLGRAGDWAARSRELGASDDLLAQILWRQLHAKVLARRGEGPEAERLGREAIHVAERTDMLDVQALAYDDLGEVLGAVNRFEEAAVAYEQALVRFEQKENLAGASRVRARLEALGTAPAR